jgi:hypothetical protein
MLGLLAGPEAAALDHVLDRQLHEQAGGPEQGTVGADKGKPTAPAHLHEPLRVRHASAHRALAMGVRGAEEELRGRDRILRPPRATQALHDRLADAVPKAKVLAGRLERGRVEALCLFRTAQVVADWLDTGLQGQSGKR